MSVEIVGAMDVKCRSISTYTFSWFLKVHDPASQLSDLMRNFTHVQQAEVPKARGGWETDWDNKELGAGMKRAFRNSAVNP